MTNGKINTPLTAPSCVPLAPIPNNRALNSLLEAMSGVVLYFDDAGAMIHCNARAHDWNPRENLIGSTFVELAPGWDDAAEKQREIMQVMRTGKAMLGLRERAQEAGENRWYRVDKMPIEGDSGGIQGVVVTLCDITDSVRREQQLRCSELQYRAYLSNSADGIWRYDLCPPIDVRLPVAEQTALILKQAVLAECNDKLASLYGAAGACELIGLPLHHNGDPNTRQDVSDFVSNSYRLEARENQRHTRQGHTLMLQVSATGVVERGLLTKIWGATRDVTEQSRYLARMEYLADHDVLTSLPNRAVLYRTMGKAIKERANDQKMALLLIDLDRFKEINDTLGHLAGDKLLKQLGARLQALLCETSGMIARLGGDEFAIFLSNVRNPQQAVVLAYKMLDAISLVFEVEGLHTEISASIGIAICPDQAADVSTLMRFADVAMYRAKTSLQGVAIYDSAFDPHSPKRLELMGALGRGIREQQLVLHFQPKINMRTDKVYGFEALIRWNHPQLGFISPNDFIPIAEHSNLIYPLTLWVLENGIARCKTWLEQGVKITLALNLSARNLMDDRIVLDIKRLLEQYQVPGECLELEITESMIMADPSRAESALHRIFRLGVKLAVDDFGTGYSSLAYLKRLPVQTLKIDSSFVRTMLSDEQDEIIVNSTIHLAHNLGLQVVAEGVESRATYEKLAELGCDSAQGYFMGRPLPADEAERWLRESEWGLTPSSA